MEGFLKQLKKNRVMLCMLIPATVFVIIFSYIPMGGIVLEYYGAAEPPVRCGESHLSGLTEPLRSL